MFELSDKQSETANNWIEKHVDADGKTCSKKYHGAIGGCFTYSFTGTSLGQVIKISCAACNQKIDISDYESW